MKGETKSQFELMTTLNVETFVAPEHRLRQVKEIVDGLLKELEPEFRGIYSKIGRPSIPPEQLLRALLLMVLYGLPSERQLMEHLRYNILFRWFVGLDLSDPVWDATVFTKNRERLLDGEIARLFFEGVKSHARLNGLMSDDHFSVDGTQLEAWASHKSVKRIDDQDDPPDDDDPGNPDVDFRGEKRSNQTHRSTSDPDARLMRKGKGKEAKLCYTGHVLMENRNGLVADASVSLATGRAEVDSALELLDSVSPGCTVGADKGYDTADFVTGATAKRITPHVAQNTSGRRSNIDGRTTRHAGYQTSQRKRKRIEEIFGWMKTVGGLRKLRWRGKRLVEWIFVFACAAYNLARIPKLLTRAA
jgi:transposase